MEDKNENEKTLAFRRTLNPEPLREARVMIPGSSKKQKQSGLLFLPPEKIIFYPRPPPNRFRLHLIVITMGQNQSVFQPTGTPHYTDQHALDNARMGPGNSTSGSYALTGNEKKRRWRN
jgi:hypothetical protein